MRRVKGVNRYYDNNVLIDTSDDECSPSPSSIRVMGEGAWNGMGRICLPDGLGIAMLLVA